MSNPEPTEPPITDAFVPVVNRQVHAVELDGEAVLLDVSTDRLHHLNPSATLLWACFDGRADLREICGVLAETVGVPYPQVLDDSIEVVRRFLFEGLLVTSDEAQPAEPQPRPVAGTIAEPENH